MDSSGSGVDQVAGYHEHVNELSGPIKFYLENLK
jgi:hypothetical protein